MSSNLGNEDVMNLRKKSDKYYLRGIPLFVISLVFLAGWLFVQVPIIFVIILVLIGFSFLVFSLYYFYKGYGLNNIIRSAEIIQQIEPDELIVTEDFVVGRKKSVYLLTKRTYKMLSLIRFNDLIETDEKKIKIKLPWLKIGRKKKIAGIHVFYARGRYTIPIAKDRYATGDAVSYTFETEYELIFGIPVDNRPPKERLMNLIEELEKEII